MESTYSNYNDDHDNPLLNTIFTLYIIINLYFPYCLIKLIIFPILISSLILLFILRLGVSQQQQQPQHTSLRFELVARTCLEHEPIININTDSDSDSDSDPDSKLDLEFTPTLTIKEQVINKNDRTQPEDKPGSMNEEGFLEWTVWAPLEVIYEEDEYEEETKKDTVSYTDTESSSWSFDEEFGKIQRWKEEEGEEEEGMFEIALDYHGICDKSDYFMVKKLRKEIVNEVVDEEDNLIEIDISPSNLSDHEFNW